MKKHTKRLIALLVLLAMLLGTCYATDLSLGGEEISTDPIETPDPDTTPDPNATLDPDATPDPDATLDPDATPDPDTTPEDTETPEVTPEPTEIPGLDGTTSPVDSSTTLADGVYAPEGFSFSGGSGKTKISCSQVSVSGGKASATIAFSSSSYEYVKASGGKYYASIVDGKSTFTIPVALNRDNAIIGMTSAMSTQREIAYTIHVTLTETPASEETPVPEETPVATETPAPTETPVEDGEYNTSVDSSSSMFKVVSCKLTAQDGKYTATIVLSGTGYDLLYLGSAEDAAAADSSQYIPFVPNAEGKYTYTFPVSKLDAPIAVAAHSISKDLWYDRTLTFKSEGMEKVEKPVEDGEYNTSVDSSSSMFKVVSCKLTAQGGRYTATIALSGTGYDLLYLGSAEDAAAADSSQYIPFVPNAEGKYTYTFPVSKLDAPIAVAAHSVSKDLWYDRTLTFKSEGMEKIEGEPTPTPVPTATPTPEPTEAPEADLSGSTSKVDSSTTLADGTYTPDKFSFSGGTGKVKISCTKVTVSGGKAKATLVFDSPNYSYVKASGSKFYGSHGGSSSTFEIPVKLNANNRIIGMTTAMSVDHEVEYTIYVYIKAADASAQAAAEAGAPEIAGLTYASSDEIESAALFSIYRYEGGFTLIDVVDGGRCLLIPEGAEVPAGTEDEATLIQLPVQSAYVASESALTLIDGVEIPAETDPVKLSGCEGLRLNRIAAEQLSFAGAWTAPDYTALLMSGCDLAILPEPFSADEATATPEERASAASVAERLALLGIPCVVDRSAAEESEQGRLEWIKVYGAILGFEDAAQAAYEQAVAALNA